MGNIELKALAMLILIV